MAKSVEKRIAVPVVGEVFCEHFGRCDGFYLCDVARGEVGRSRVVRRPRSRCESVPTWLAEMGVNVVLVGGIGVVGIRRLAELGMEVVIGQGGAEPRAIVEKYAREGCGSRENPCADFEHRHRHCKAPRPARKSQDGE